MASDTPRTDAAIAACLAESKYEPPIGPLAELARQLERDLSRVIGQFNAAVLELAQRPEARHTDASQEEFLEAADEFYRCGGPKVSSSNKAPDPNALPDNDVLG